MSREPFCFLEGERAQAESVLRRAGRTSGRGPVFARRCAPLPPSDMRDEIEVMAAMDDEVTLFGRLDGRGLVMLSDHAR